MAAMADGTAHDLHGAQVGVASIVAAALWEVALDEVGLGALDPWSLAPARRPARAGARCWIGLDPSGRLGAECWAAVERKFDDLGARTAPRRPGSSAAGSRTRRPCAATPTRRRSRPGRCTGGVPPLRFGDADPGGRRRTGPGGRCACLPFMRDRFTLADLLLLAGRWTDDLVERVLDRAARAGGGL